MECPNDNHHMLPHHRWHVVERGHEHDDPRTHFFTVATFGTYGEAVSYAEVYGLAVKEIPLK